MEHAHDESEYSSSRMNSRYPELSRAKVQPERQEDLSFSVSSLQEPQTSKEETKEILPLLNGYINHVIIREREDNSSQDENRHRDVDVSHEMKYDIGDDNLNDNDDDAVNGDNNGGDDDNKDDNNDDGGNDDDDDDDDDNDDDDDDDDNDDDDDDDDDDDGCGGCCDFDDGNNNYAYYHDDYRSQDASFSREDENFSLLSNRVNESVTLESSFSLRVTSGNDHETNNTENIVHRPGNNKNNISRSSSSSSRNEESSWSKNDDFSELFVAGSTTLRANETNSPTASAAGNFTIQGARPKTSRTPELDNVDSPDYYSGKIPSLEITGINQGFLARHTTDQTLPYSSYNGDDGWPASEPTSFINWPQTSITRSDSSTSPWNLPPPPGPERSGLIREDAFSRGMHPRYMDPMHGGYQPGEPMTSLGGWPSGWQPPNRHQTHPGRTASYFPPEYQRCYIPNSWLAGDGESSHLSPLGHFPGISGTQGASLFNRQAWMPSNYETTWRWPKYDYSGYQPNLSNFGDFATRSEPAINSPVVNPPAPTNTLATSNLPDGGVRLPATTVRAPLTSSSTSSTGSGSVSSNRFPSNSYSSNRQERVGDFSTNSSFASEQQGNHGFPSTETTSSRRQEESLRNSDSLNSSQEGLQTWDPSQDDSLVALERKVAEACAVVERVLKEREERTKKQREALQRQREIRQQREREERERREREEQQRREIAERETREREDMAVEERAPVQESPLWQCEHYQRRCRVRFPCCGVFYPCHRCHNGSGACDADDKKANQATHVKCANCGHEEEINERSQNCSNCGCKLSEYFCFKCKHFTGVDKNPFHCSKCGICRIYKDRSFHCDVCNVCLDKRLEGKHKCRPDSGHDECCICLEDAFSGCQILPCSHKVHRECAIAMIQNGVRSCPICRHPLYSQGSQ